MAYRIQEMSCAEGGTSYRKYRIYNNDGAFAELSERGAAVEDIFIHLPNGEGRGMLTRRSVMQFYLNKQPLSTQASLWRLVGRGENSLTFAWPVNPGNASACEIVLRYGWMDHNRLVIDVCGRPETGMSFALCSDVAFSLAGGADAHYRWKPFCPCGSGEDTAPDGGELLPAANHVLRANTAGLQPLLELVCPSSDMTMTAYAAPCELRLTYADAVQKVGIQISPYAADVTPCSWRIVYGFDPVYHGPAQVMPFSF